MKNTALRVHRAAAKYVSMPGQRELKYDKLDRCYDNAKTYEARAVLRALSSAMDMH